MNLETQKAELVKKIKATKNEAVLQGIESVFDLHANGWYDSLPKAAKVSVERGSQQVRDGKIKSHTEVMKKYKKWLSKK